MSAASKRQKQSYYFRKQMFLGSLKSRGDAAVKPVRRRGRQEARGLGRGAQVPGKICLLLEPDILISEGTDQEPNDERGQEHLKPEFPGGHFLPAGSLDDDKQAGEQG
jgi:hypothetical protein